MDAPNKPRANRKKRRALRSIQKQHAKKGRFGQGHVLSEDTFKYFIRIMEVANHSKNNDEEMKVLANNVLEEIKGKEIETCSNQLASRVVEDLIMHASDEKLIEISNAFAPEHRLVFTDSFCSHVLQKVIFTLAHRVLIDEQSKRPKEIIEQFIASFVRTARYAFSNLEDFIFDPYANRILRTIFACTNGYVTKMEIEKMDVKEKRDVLPDEFEDLGKSFVEKIITWPQFNDLSTQVLTSGCLQALVYSVRGNMKFSKKLSGKVLEACGEKDLRENNEPLVHLVEAAMTIAPPKIISKFYAMLKGQLGEFAVLKSTNFIVQKLLNHCVVKEEFEEIFDEVAKIIPRVIELQFTGVVAALASACRRLKAKQGEFINVLVKSFNCEDSPERQLQLAFLAVCLVPENKYQQGVTKTSFHGSMVVQDMLHFTKPIRVVSSLLSSSNLSELFNDRNGCHIADAFVASTFVGEKSREKLFKKLQNHYVSLASSKHGSRAFDAIWSVLSANQKVLVMEELKAEQSAVVSTMYGRIITSKYMLDLYREDKNMWMRKFGGKARAKEEK